MGKILVYQKGECQMNRKKKIAFIISISCIAAGIVLAVAALAVVKFDFSKLSTVQYNTTTCRVEETFTKLDIQVPDCDIHLIPSEDGTCRIVSTESENVTQTIEVKNDTLVVRRTDDRRWYERIGMYWGNFSVTVYLPENVYDDLKAKSTSGNITIQKGLTFQNAEIVASSGDISFDGIVKSSLTAKTTSGNLSICNQTGGKLDIQSTSGNIMLNNINVDILDANSTSGNVVLQTVAINQEIFLKSVSGELTGENMSGKSLTAKTGSGNIKFTDVVIKGDMELEATSGDIRFTRNDAENIVIKTASGNINGSLLSNRLFHFHTVSGDVSVPDSVSSAKRCEASTTSGDIHITIEP